MTAAVEVTRADGLLTVKQLAELCGVQPITVYQWTLRGYRTRDGKRKVILPAIEVDGRKMIDPVEGAKAEWHTRIRGRRAPALAEAAAGPQPGGQGAWWLGTG